LRSSKAVTSERYSSHSCFLLRRNLCGVKRPSDDSRRSLGGLRSSGRPWSLLVGVGRLSTAHRRPGSGVPAGLPTPHSDTTDAHAGLSGAHPSDPTWPKLRGSVPLCKPGADRGHILAGHHAYGGAEPVGGRLHRRYERRAEHFLAFAALACTLICYRRLTT
jgi:hypothetical protein